VHRNKFLCNKTNYMHQFHKFILSWNSTCFGQFVCPSSGVYSLYTQQWCMSYRFVDSCRAGLYFVMKPYMFRTVRLFIIRSLFTVHSAMVYVIQVCRQLSSRTGSAWHIPLPSVQWTNSWWWTDEPSETCRVSWQNKVLLDSCLQTCMTYITAVCTVNKLLIMDRRTVRNM
jgi:hypothetical protein